MRGSAGTAASLRAPRVTRPGRADHDDAGSLDGVFLSLEEEEVLAKAGRPLGMADAQIGDDRFSEGPQALPGAARSGRVSSASDSWVPGMSYSPSLTPNTVLESPSPLPVEYRQQLLDNALRIPAGSLASSGSSSSSRQAISTCTACMRIRAELAMMRQEFAEEFEQRQVDARQRLRSCQEEAQRVMAERVRQKQLRALTRRAARHSEATVFAAELSVAELRQGLEVEAASAVAAAKWRDAALSCGAELAEAELRTEEAVGRVSKEKRHAAEAGRQLRDLAKQNSTQHAQKLHSELESVRRERDNLDERVEQLAPRFEQAQAEESQLARMLPEQAQAVTVRLQARQSEALEFAQVKEELQVARRSSQSQRAALATELGEATSAKRESAAELSRLQRQRLEEVRRARAAQGEQRGLRCELERLQGQLRWAEQALQMREAHWQREEEKAARVAQPLSPASGLAVGEQRAAPTALDAPSASAAVRTPSDFGAHAAPTSSMSAESLGTSRDRFLEAMERARERTSQRQDRNLATDEVRARAQALQELFAKELADERGGHLA